MKISTIMIAGLIVVFCLPALKFQAEDLPSLSADCLENRGKRDVEFNKAIMKDIITGLELDIDDQSYTEVTDRGLDAAHLIYGGKELDEVYQSLHQQFIVASRGKPSLFVRPLEAYLLYKQPDNTNVAVHLKLTNFKWEVVEKKKAKGNAINYKLLKCEKEYLKKKREYYNKD
ncbi:hypothetical protein J1P26_15655 [Neobacillus sp. MM2021_6]|uniref:hypothetical protein n=1 Tax=Bacillaceae TaxID=186817 RepID=UPI00140C3C10|nr:MULTISPECIES: hypothetical protein [Bacillaceae]MBO0961137.1 hypothetical protein [Neobacillus sp. MM2021_6]NHC19352.1 hypothetical protein [Bacillus sp. MM2020_4]